MRDAAPTEGMPGRARPHHGSSAADPLIWGGALILTLVAWALGAGMGCTNGGGSNANVPTVNQPPASAQIFTASAYVRVQVLTDSGTGEKTFEVFVREGLQDPAIDVTAQFTFDRVSTSTKEYHHANLELPIGTHEVWVVQHDTANANSPWQGVKRQFSLTSGPVTEVGALTGANGGTAGQVVSQAIGGAVERPAPATDIAFLFGETTLNGVPTQPTTAAFSTDTDLSGDYYDEAGSSSIEAALGPLVAGESEIALASAFVDGADVYAFYWRIHTSGPRELGLARMTGGVAPFARLTFASTSALFGDQFSLFEDGELQPGAGAVVSGTDLYVYGLHQPAGATDDEVFVARVSLSPTNLADQASAYEYWMGSSWQQSPSSAPASLWSNSGPPSVTYNTNEARWVGVHSVQQGPILPYGVTDDHSAMSVRVAQNLAGPWTEPVVVWERPQTQSGGKGSAFTPVVVPGLEVGSTITVAANDGGEWTRPENALLYEIDLGALVFPPALDIPPGTVFDNPYPATGFANPGDLVRVYVNGEEQGSDTAQADGSFVVPIVLVDGPNSVYAQADRGGLLSDPSTVVSFNYENDDNKAITVPTTTIDEHTVWTPGVAPGVTGPYVISGGAGHSLVITNGATLTLQPGVEVRFNGNLTLRVDPGSKLVVQGSAGQRVVFQSDSPSPGAGDWSGLRVEGSATLDHVDIRHANNAIDVVGNDLQLTNATITEFASHGILLQSGATGHIGTGTTVDNASGSANADCIRMISITAGAVTMDGASVQNCKDGLRLESSSPDIQGTMITGHSQKGMRILAGSSPNVHNGCVVTNNDDGIFVSGSGAAPLVTESDLYNNAGYDYYTETTGAELSASGNWWGTIDPATIADNIRDHSDAASVASVQWLPFLDDQFSAGGVEVQSGGFLNGTVSSPIQAGPIHLVVGDVRVPAGQTLTIEEGAELQFLPGMRLEADGTLVVAGTSSQPVYFGSSAPNPMPGDWDGIYITSSSTGSQIQHAVIDHADSGINITGATVYVSDAVISEPGTSGIALTDSSSQISNNTITRSSFGGSGVSVLEPIGSSAIPDITGNVVAGFDHGALVTGPATTTSAITRLEDNTFDLNETGVRVVGAASPFLTENFIRNNTKDGIRLEGFFGGFPQPTITRNDIHTNGSAGSQFVNLNTLNYGSPLVIDASENWWNTQDPVAIGDEITDLLDGLSKPIVNFTPFLDNSISSGGQSVLGDYFVGGSLPAGTVLSTGVNYVVTGDIDVPVGDTLVVEAGSTLSFLPGAHLDVFGTIDGLGGTFTTASTGSCPGSWEGLRLHPGSSATLDGLVLDCVVDGIDASGAAVDISGSTTISNFTGSAVTFRDGATGSIAGATISQPSGTGAIGIEVANSAPAISDNQIIGLRTGIHLTGASPSITRNTVDANNEPASVGINIQQSSAPTISDLNVIQDHVSSGILIEGFGGNPALNPAPVISGNDILNNNNVNLRAQNFGDHTNATVDATLNYWGTHDEFVVPTWIDVSSPTAPTVNVFPFLLSDRVTAHPPTSSLISGPISSTTLTAAGSPWSIVGDTTVQALETLTVEAGAVVRVYPGVALNVAGTLTVSGASGSRAVFESADATAPIAAWEGIYLLAGSGSSAIDFAEVRDAHHGVDIDGVASASVTNTDFIDFTGVGIKVRNSTATITGNSFSRPAGGPPNGIFGIHLEDVDGNTLVSANDPISDADHGIHVVDASPNVQGNTIRDNLQGIHITDGSAPVIDRDNSITQNRYGIQVAPGAGPLPPVSNPVINDNDIFDNDTSGPLYNFFAVNDAGVVEIDAANNYWGEPATAAQVALGIVDASDGGTGRPYVDAVPFRDVNGATVVDPTGRQFLGGYFPDNTVTNLSVDTTYDATGNLVVPSGATLNIPEGATINMVDGAAFEVHGKLDATGAVGNPVTFTREGGSAGSWEGLVFESTSVGSELEEVLIENAARAVWVRETDVTITNVEIMGFAETGIWIDGTWDPVAQTGATGGAVSGAWVHNTPPPHLGTGIYLTSVNAGQGAAPTISNTRIEGTTLGIFMDKRSSPQISGSTVTGNHVGIWIAGGHSLLLNPLPVVSDSNLFQNLNGSIETNLRVTDYWFEGTSQVLSFVNNYWGSTNPATIRQNVDLPSDPQQALVNFSDPLVSEGGAPSTATIYSQLVHSVSHSPDGFDPLVPESVDINFELAAPATSVDIHIYQGTGASLVNPVRTIAAGSLGAGPQTIPWDGKDDGGAYVQEDGYAYTIDADGFLYAPALVSFAGGQAPVVDWADSQDPGYNTHRNEFWKRQFSVTNQPAEVKFRIKTAPGVASDAWRRVLAPGTHELVWDGRDHTGAPFEGLTELFTNSDQALRYNLVVVEGTEPRITGESPHIEVKADPWLVTHSYDQVSKLTYQVDHDSDVTVKVLPLGIHDPADPNAVVLVNNQSRTANTPYSVTWTGLEVGPQGNDIVNPPSEGPHTFTIEATSQVTGHSTLYRGTLQMRQ